MCQLLFVGRRVRATKTYNDELGSCLSRLTWLREHLGRFGQDRVLWSVSVSPKVSQFFSQGFGRLGRGGLHRHELGSSTRASGDTITEGAAKVPRGDSRIERLLVEGKRWYFGMQRLSCSNNKYLFRFGIVMAA